MGPGVRVASGVYEGADIPPYYDSLFMLLMTAGADREDAVRVMDRAHQQKPPRRRSEDPCPSSFKHNQAPLFHRGRVFDPVY